MNNWYVITGAPSSGKTTLLSKLEKDFHVEYEIARKFIDMELKKGKKLTEIRKDELVFQKRVLALKIKLEKQLPKKEVILFERGVPDSKAYYHICGVEQDIFLEKAIKGSWYRKVFLLNPLVYRKDYARTENEKLAKEIDIFLEKAYKQLHLSVIRVPVLSVEQRVNFIRDHIETVN